MLYATTYHYAGFEIEAATDDKGNYYVSYRVIENTLGWRADSTREKIASKQFKKDSKAFLKGDSQLGTIKANTNKSNSKKNWIKVGDFFKIMFWEMSKGNELAKELVFAGFTTDFMTTMQAHFGKVLTEEEKEYMRELIAQRIAAFRNWTDIIRDRYIQFYGRKPEGWEYGVLVKRANLAIFGVPDFGYDRTVNMTKEQQETIKEFELFLLRKAKNNPNWSPEHVLNTALDHFTN